MYDVLNRQCLYYYRGLPRKVCKTGETRKKEGYFPDTSLKSSVLCPPPLITGGCPSSTARCHPPTCTVCIPRPRVQSCVPHPGVQASLLAINSISQHAIVTYVQTTDSTDGPESAIVYTIDTCIEASPLTT